MKETDYKDYKFPTILVTVSDTLTVSLKIKVSLTRVIVSKTRKTIQVTQETQR